MDPRRQTEENEELLRFDSVSGRASIGAQHEMISFQSSHFNIRAGPPTEPGSPKISKKAPLLFFSQNSETTRGGPVKDAPIDNEKVEELKAKYNVKSFIVHQVDRNDTIQGLEMQYQVPKFLILRFNELNSDDIFWLKYLLIPDPSTLSTPLNHHSSKILEKQRETTQLQPSAGSLKKQWP